jgi:hypothetical protein
MSTKENSLKRCFRIDVAAAALAGLGAVYMAGCGDQPKPNCITSPAPFAMKLIMQGAAQESIPGACMTFGPDAFNADPEVGFVSYYERDSKGQPNYAKGSLAIQTTEIGTLFYTAKDLGVENSATDGTVYSLGAYDVAEPDSNNICGVTTLSPTHIVLAAIPAVPDDPATSDEDESVPGQAAVDARLAWSNVKVYVTAASFGIQAQADLTDTRVAPGGGTCTFNYRTVSLAPAVPCALLDPDTGDPLSNPDGSPQLDLGACDPVAHPELGRTLGSGISPSTSYICDPASAFCVLEGDTVPALK